MIGRARRPANALPHSTFAGRFRLSLCATSLNCPPRACWRGFLFEVMHKVIHIFYTLPHLGVLLISQSYLFAGQGITILSPRNSPSASSELLTSVTSTTDSAIVIGPAPGSDSVKYPLDEILVVSSRTPTSAEHFSLSTEALSRNDITDANSTSLAGILSSSTGLFVKDYGGTSALKTLSQRGMGTEHTLVLVNGLRVTSSQNGLIDLGIVPLTGIQYLEVVSGGNSASFGSEAVAGLVNIITLPRDRKSRIEATTSVGSFGFVNGSVAASLDVGSIFFRAFYGVEESDDDFEFQFDDGSGVQTLRRQNADVEAQNGGIDASIRLSEQQELTLSFGAYGSERGVGGPVVSANPTSSARQQDDRQLLQIGWKANLSALTILSVQTQGHRSYQRYHDPELNIGGFVVDNYFTNLDLRIAPTLNTTFTESFSLAVGGEVARVQAIGNTMAQDELRTSGAAFVVVHAKVFESSGPVARVDFSPGVRFDGESAGFNAWSPQAGVVVSFQEFDALIEQARLFLTANFSRNFRSPTFNELYYNGGGGVGNPDLQPERSTNMDAGLRASFGRHEFRASYFNISMENRIVWVAAGAGVVTPKNLRATRSDGFEVSCLLSVMENAIVLGGNFSQTHSVKTEPDYPGDPSVGNQLIYVPEQTLRFSLVLRQQWESWMQEAALEGRFAYIGYRYFTEDNTHFLPSYSLVDIIARARLAVLGGNIALKFEINNALNESYQVTSGYPMPMRSFRTTVALAL